MSSSSLKLIQERLGLIIPLYLYNVGFLNESYSSSIDLPIFIIVHYTASAPDLLPNCFIIWKFYWVFWLKSGFNAIACLKLFRLLPKSKHATRRLDPNHPTSFTSTSR